MDELNKTNVFVNRTFEKLNADDQIVKSKEFERCTFRQCSFVKTSFVLCRFIECTFIECTLSAVVLTNSICSEVKFIDSKVIGIDWTRLKTLTAPQFNNSQLDYCNFRFVKIPKIKMTDCVVHEADFTECDMHESNFRGTDFAGTIFFKTNLAKANFVSAFNYGIDSRANNIKKARFSLPEAASLLRSLEIILVGW
jgi:fluoroquinolone resistance protein